VTPPLVFALWQTMLGKHSPFIKIDKLKAGCCFLSIRMEHQTSVM
jgi:hypothetical protein